MFSFLFFSSSKAFKGFFLWKWEGSPFLLNKNCEKNLFEALKLVVPCQEKKKTAIMRGSAVVGKKRNRDGIPIYLIN
jgi:hypothetical protein